MKQLTWLRREVKVTVNMMWQHKPRGWRLMLCPKCCVTNVLDAIAFTADIWRSFWEEPLPLPAHHPGHPREVPGWGEFLSSKTPWPNDFLQIKRYLNRQSKMIRCIWKPLIHNFMKRLCDGCSLLLPVLVHYFEISLLHYSCSARHKPLVMYLSSINHSVLLSWRFLWDPAGPNYICRHLVGEVQPVRTALSFLYGFLSLF